MPEIAEVRLIADNIEAFLKNKQIIQIELLHPETIVKYAERNINGLAEFNQAIANNPINVISVNTRGKFCWIELKNQSSYDLGAQHLDRRTSVKNAKTDLTYFIMIGFGMSGNIRPEPTPEYLQSYNQVLAGRGAKSVTRDEFMKHCHLKICFQSPLLFNNNGPPILAVKSAFYYHDVRRFGSWIFTTDRTQLDLHLAKLGHDPLVHTQLTPIEIINIMRTQNNKNICKALMSQELFAGVGNYCKCEMLYAAKVHPLAVIKDLPDESLVDMYQAFHHIAHEAYQNGGASLYTYTGINGDQTEYKETLHVYNKPTDPLGNQVVRIPDKESPDRRSTFWVPLVQIIGFVEPSKLKIPAPKIK